MKVTIADVAKKAGVSKSTVSRILNGNYEQNTVDTVNKVLNVIKELDYRPNALAKSLKSMKTNVIGIVLSNLKNPFWVNVLEGVEDTCRKHGFNLMICNSNEEAELEEEHIRSFQMKQVDGMIINPTLKNLTIYQKLIKNEFPLVSINRKLSGLNIDTVTMNNIEGAKLAVEHLIGLGNRKIAIIVYPPDDISPRIERIEGYKKGLQENGIDFDPSMIRIVEERKGEVKKQVRDLLSGHDKPDAIFSTNNIMTLEVLEGIKDLQLNVPEDLSVIGYDETVWSKHLKPALTTVYQPAYDMGELAAKKLIQRINKKGSEMETLTLEPRLIVRDSCGAGKERIST
ncbi:LacI family DNA-binding transcriptional regulator [Bacillus sp. Marseille-Q3570]|uniref:LacI family DNA-binding transcriptional regulator n=1 Tax=Bacillus sp. Marseille-Q3570 TaxID=2963522 RepID=UPI0021B777A1|nr:LacI family DNA-binding transcriptional regulator [Bacillus sp. Marseille-Q3570]